MIKAYRLLRERLATPDEDMLEDVSFALGKLRESIAGADAADGRLSTLQDLKQQVEAVESTHDPENIMQLIDSIKTFLGEEMREESDEAEKQGGPMNGLNGEERTDEPFPEEEERTEQAEAGPPSDTVTCEACGHTMALKEMAAATGAVPGPVGEAEAPAEYPPEEEERMNESTAAEEKEDEVKPQVESQSGTRQRESAAGLNDLERAELLLFRRRESEAKAHAGKLAKARRKIKESGIDFKPEDLVSFQESQWSTILNMATAMTPKSYNGERSYGALVESAAPQAKSARDVFNRAFEQ